MLSHKDKLKLVDELISKNADSTIGDYLQELEEIEAEVASISQNAIKDNTEDANSHTTLRNLRHCIRQKSEIEKYMEL